MRTGSWMILTCAACAMSLGLTRATTADELTLVIGGQTIELSGEILIEAKDTSLLFRARDGKFWFVKPEQIKNKISNDDPFVPLSKKEIGQLLLKELPAGFRIHETKHYVIAYQNEFAYAKWVGGLYEGRLYRAFESFWKRKKRFVLSDPDYPLVAIVFGNQAEYQRYVDRELGPGQSMVAYYNLQTNRVTMYDLTSRMGPANQQLDDRRINQILQSPAAVAMVATMIHEATHQLIFNRGIQKRFAESPLWLNEGLAMYFEAPNLRSKRGWQKPGEIFQRRLVHFREFSARRPENSLETLIMDNERLTNSDTSVDAYSESWALVHFLIERKPKEFPEYLQFMSAKKTLVEDAPETRLADFKRFFGEDLSELNKDLLNYIRRLR